MSIKQKKRIYLDCASTTPLDPIVKRAMEPYFSKDFGSPGSIHTEGVFAKQALEDSRLTIARILGSRKEEIFFTSGGTESNNLAVVGAIEKLHREGLAYKDMHVITSSIEHSSILQCFHELERRGVSVDYAPVTPEGILNLREFEKKLRPNTVLVSIMYANNEIGTIQPIGKISKIIKAFLVKSKSSKKIIFHTDASQGALFLPLNVYQLGIDLLTLDGHKLYGPKGVGVLYKKSAIEIQPLLYGGGQEHELRSGTENIPLIVGMAKALSLVESLKEKENARLTSLRDYCIKKIKEISPEIILNGDEKIRLPNNINISIPNIDTEFLVLKFDLNGIALSTKSACLDSDMGSYVVASLGGDEVRSKSTLRISLGRSTTKKEIDSFLKVFKRVLVTEELL